MVRILAGREGFTFSSTAADVFTLASDVVRFPDNENLSDEYEDPDDKYSVEAYLIDDSYLSAEEYLSEEAAYLSRVILVLVSSTSKWLSVAYPVLK